MHPFLNSLTRSRLSRLLLLTVPLLFVGGCGGGGDSSSGSTTTTTSDQVLGPKIMVGAVLVMNYADGRSYTFTFNNSNPNGVTRSDGKISTNWTSAALSSPVVTVDIAYGAFTPGDLNSVFDDYGLHFVTKTTGNITLRENTTSNTFAATPVLAGTFTFTTYPPNG